MKGTTNSQQLGGAKTEIVNVYIKTNQVDHSDISGIAVKVVDSTTGVVIGEQVYDGSALTFKVPAGVTYSLSIPDVAGYRTPAVSEQIATEGNSRTFTLVYETELVTVNVSANEGALSSYEVTIAKKTTVGVSAKYIRLEYIESTGTQYIDTGFMPSQNTRVVMDFENKGDYSDFTTGLCPFFGARNASSSAVFALWIGAKTYPHYGDVSYSANGYFEKDLNARFTYDFNKNVVSIGDDTIACTEASFATSHRMCLLTINNYGTIESRRASGKLYSCQIYDNGTLVRDYIPALSEDGIAGLYDSVNDTFYVSAGTENFAAGDNSTEAVATQTTATGTYKIPFGTAYTVSASAVDLFISPDAQSYTASLASRTVSMEYISDPVIDLSMYDSLGNPINQSTANCYVVRQPGQYKFPLVYGNAIKNGKMNTAAFTNNGGVNSHDFVNYNGIVITSPYIEVVEESATSVQLSNTDTDGVFSDLSIVDGESCRYVLFTVASVPSEGANGIISIKNSGDTIKWNWHIWVWPHDLTPVAITNATGVEYNIMPVNLASKYDSDGTHIKNWFYQWGRMTPLLCPSAYDSNTDHSPGSITKTSKAKYLCYGIETPNTFYYNSSSPWNWFGDSYYNLWDAACTTTGTSDNDVVKTVYDPCPVGWKVPNGNTFTGVSIISSANDIVKMARYSGDTVGVDFPLSGCRRYSDGLLSAVGLDGLVWLSAANSYSLTYLLYFDSSGVSYSGSYRAYGYSVRPVEDDIENITIAFYINDTTYYATEGMTWAEWCNSGYSNGEYGIDSIGRVYNIETDIPIHDGTGNNVPVSTDVVIIFRQWRW